MFDMGFQPMSLVALQSDPAQSHALETHPIMLSICRYCTHVFNSEFNPQFVNYSAAGCRMYNEGAGWQEHMGQVRQMIEPIVGLDLVIEIGAGDCTFLNSLNMKSDCVKLAVDPCEAVERAEEFGIHYERAMFDPDKHIPDGAQDTLIIMRHLLEHMTDPRQTMETLANKARLRRHTTYFYIEVPCCENALHHRRIEDWTYEHPQHFTVNSMRALLRSCGLDHFMVIPGYNREVLKVLVKHDPVDHHDADLDVNMLVGDYNRIENNIARERSWLKAHNYCIAYWGGAGKSAMFLRRMGVPSDALVVDSHEAKWGMYVPGTRIVIHSPRQLYQAKPDYIIATASWRAEDVRREIIQFGYPCKTLLKFEGGELTEVPLGR
jgi:hypothetical protein